MVQQTRSRSKKQRVKEALVDNTPITANVTRPHQSGLTHYITAWRVDKLPPFNIWVADLMRYDPVVSFGLALRSGPLFTADAEITGGRPEVREFIQKQWNRIWNSSAHKILRTREYGYAGFEVMYQTEPDGMIGFKHLKDLHPSMVRPLTLSNEVKGLRVRPHGSFGNFYSPLARTDIEEQHTLLAPKGLWTSFEGRFENPFGESILEHSYSAWWEKWMEHGAKRSAMLRMVKDAWIGDIFYYPPNMKMQDEEGNEIPVREWVREMGENRLSGAIMTIPMIRDSNGQQLTQYVPPHAIPGETQIFDWQERLNIEIWKGMDIPREVIEAAGTGSGFSGRSIPFVAFISLLMTEFQELVECIDRMVLRPLAHLNFGVRPEYEIKVMEVNDLVQKIVGGSSMSAMGGGGIGMGGNPLAALMGGGGMQMSEADDVYRRQESRVAGQSRPGRSGAATLPQQGEEEDGMLEKAGKGLWNMYNALPYTASEVMQNAGVGEEAAEKARWLMAMGQMAPFGMVPPAAVTLAGAAVQPSETWGAIKRAMARVRGKETAA